MNAPNLQISKIQTVFRVTSGNFLEMFDFFLFGLYASQISATFFPLQDQAASLMATFATFGAGFLMRPLGAVILGAAKRCRLRLAAGDRLAPAAAVPGRCRRDTAFAGVVPAQQHRPGHRGAHSRRHDPDDLGEREVSRHCGEMSSSLRAEGEAIQSPAADSGLLRRLRLLAMTAMCDHRRTETMRSAS